MIFVSQGMGSFIASVIRPDLQDFLGELNESMKQFQKVFGHVQTRQKTKSFGCRL